MNVLFVAAEMSPFAKTGGLGDVVGALPKALRAQGIDARVVMPHYSMITQGEYLMNYPVPRRQGGVGDVSVHWGEVDGVPVYFLKSYPYFVDDGKIYTVWDWDTPRFIYFCQMAAAFIWQLAQGNANGGKPWWADVAHVHDWHTGLLPFLIHEARFNAGWNDLASVMTLHNMAFQGGGAGGWLWQEGLPNREHPLLHTQEWRDNLLAVGIAYAQKVNTVSPNHAIELHYDRFGEGLQDLIWAKDADFSGILNGIDTAVYDPATDPHISQPYTAQNFRKKRGANKLALQRELGLPVNADVPLIGLISRITPQKGIDFALPALRHLLGTEAVQFVGLGTGDPGLQAAFGRLGMEFADRASVQLRMDVGLAQRIYAGADMLLVPSRYEPCGLTQIIAMRYGCLPIVRETGGLKDTVQNFDGADSGTGFSFLFEESEALYHTLLWALETYQQNRPAWQAMQERGMKTDWGWSKNAGAYLQLYADAIAAKRAWRRA